MESLSTVNQNVVLLYIHTCDVSMPFGASFVFPTLASHTLASNKALDATANTRILGA